MVGCQDKAAMAELEEFRFQKEVEEQNIKNVYLWEKMWNEGNLDIVEQIVIPNYVEHLLGGKSSYRSLDFVKKVISDWRSSFPDLKVKVEDIIAEGDKVAFLATWTGTHRGDFGEIAPTGNKIEFSETFFNRYENGKVVESWIDWEELRFYRQLGMELRPKEEK
jgi:predicted ester cyclase